MDDDDDDDDDDELRGQETPFPTPLTISGKMIWDFKIQRRGRQRERKKKQLV